MKFIFLAHHIIYENEVIDWNRLRINENIYRINNNDDGEFNQEEEIFVKCKVKREYKTSLDGGRFKPKHSSVVQITKSKVNQITNAKRVQYLHRIILVQSRI